VIIDLLNDRGHLKACSIEGWKIRIKALFKNFQVISFHHIYRDFNKEAAKLSKVALMVPEGKITYYRWDPGGVGPMNHLDIFRYYIFWIELIFTVFRISSLDPLFTS